MKSTLYSVFLIFFLAGGAMASEAADSVDAEAAWQILKDGLVGEWQGKILHSAEPVEASFYLTGNDSAIVEYIGRPQRPAASMSTVYHLADEHLQLTHYCSMQNQPRLRAASISADGKTINFELLDVTNLTRSGNRYTHKMQISFPAPDRANVTYVGLDNGVEGELTVELSRVD
jgi:hypothetical protein